MHIAPYRHYGLCRVCVLGVTYGLQITNQVLALFVFLICNLTNLQVDMNWVVYVAQTAHLIRAAP
jgi:hypothetical protein